jgi:hypothetical protein
MIQDQMPPILSIARLKEGQYLLIGVVTRFEIKVDPQDILCVKQQCEGQFAYYPQ